MWFSFLLVNYISMHIYNQDNVVLIAGKDSWSWKSTFWDGDIEVYDFGCTSEYLCHYSFRNFPLPM